MGKRGDEVVRVSGVGWMDGGMQRQIYGMGFLYPRRVIEGVRMEEYM